MILYLSINMQRTVIHKLCHMQYTAFYMRLGVELNSKQRQRQNTDGLSCKLHLLTLELINTLYHNTWYHTLEANWRKLLDKDPEEKPYNN